MALGSHKRAVGVFSSRRDAEHALTELRDAGFSMAKISIIAKDGDRNDQIAGVETQKRIGNKADEGAASGAVTGTVLGGITGLLVGLGTLAIPGVGPILLAGEVASTLATAAAGAGIGAAAGGLLGGLAGLGVPEERAKIYSDRVSGGDYLVIIDGNEEEMYRAESILQNRGIQEFGIYNAPGMARGADYVNPANPVVDSIGNYDDDSKVVIVDRRDGSI
ncbi:MAG: general stress protein [Hassallia sp. WJT32-NPBG1]|nr:general stress protein [Hassallia sp. WJT32-NPBG1]